MFILTSLKTEIVVGGEINEKTADIQARSFMARTLEKIGQHAKLKEKQKWSHEKLHLDNARKLRLIYFIDPEDKEFKKTVKNARKKLETSVTPAMPCKIIKNCGSGGSNKIKTKLACILKADESTRMRMGEPLPTTLLSEKPPEGFLGSGWRLTNRQATSRPHHLWPEHWRGMSKNAKLREKHQWAIEKPKLDNARRLRGIYFIDPEDKEFKETIQKCKKKIGNTNGSSHALQDLQEEQAWRDPWQDY